MTCSNDRTEKNLYIINHTKTAKPVVLICLEIQNLWYCLAFESNIHLTPRSLLSKPMIGVLWVA